VGGGGQYVGRYNTEKTLKSEKWRGGWMTPPLPASMVAPPSTEDIIFINCRYSK